MVYGFDAYRDHREAKYYETTTNIENYTIIQKESGGFYSRTEVWFGTRERYLSKISIERAREELARDVATELRLQAAFLHGEVYDTIWIGDNVND